MGKWLLIPHHASNVFFEHFPNCLLYRDRQEFVTLLQRALTHDPQPLSDELKRSLSWEAATERCA
jgi:digalactosyldiacylglycerol synthase